MSQQANPFYYNTPEWYKGGEPAFYDAKGFPISEVLLEHQPTFKEEALGLFSRQPTSFQQNFSPYNTDLKGWRTIVLFSYGLINKKNIEKFPKTWEVLKDIEGLSLLMFSVLQPQTHLKAHFGDTDAIVRHHIGLHVPAPHPSIALRVCQEERGWSEEEVMSFCVVNRHQAWNKTDEPRLILMSDTIKPEFAHRTAEVWSKVLGAEATKYYSNKWPWTKSFPIPLTRLIHWGGSLFIRGVILWHKFRYRSIYPGKG